MNNLQKIAQQMVTSRKGILAADESVGSAGKRLASIGVENTKENRRMYRELFLATDGIENYLTGVILHDETFYQKTSDGVSFVKLLQKKNILAGIKVDEGLASLAGFDGEEITRGLDTLKERCEKYSRDGASFTKWRNVIHISEDIPTSELIHLNAITLARYARIVQDAGMVPIVEPEVILAGTHTIARAEEVTRQILDALFYQCARYRVDLSALILKTSMVVPGAQSDEVMNHSAIAVATLRVLHDVVPTEVSGIVFLSGGQSADDTRMNLNAINKLSNTNGNAPWPLTFSFARALQGPALDIWQGDKENIPAAREEFIKLLKFNAAASVGTMEK